GDERGATQAPHELPQLAASPEQRLDREDRGGRGERDRENRGKTLDISEPLEQLRNRVEDDEREQQRGLERPRDLGDLRGELSDLARARQREQQGERVYPEQDARHHAQVAEVRQGVGQVILPYTLHFLCGRRVQARRARDFGHFTVNHGSQAQQQALVGAVR